MYTDDPCWSLSIIDRKLHHGPFSHQWLGARTPETQEPNCSVTTVNMWNESLSWLSCSPCWNRHLQTSYTWGWTAGSRSVLCVYRLITPPSYHSLRSTHGSFRPQSLEDGEIFDIIIRNTKNIIKNLKFQRKIITTRPCNFQVKHLFLYEMRNQAKSEWFLPIITNWESGVNDASSVTPLLLL